MAKENVIPTIEDIAEIHAAQHPMYASEIRQLAREARALVNLRLSLDTLTDRLTDDQWDALHDATDAASHAVRDRREYIETAIMQDDRGGK